MNTSSLRAVTLQTVANCAQAAERAVVAYRVGGHRLIAAIQRGVDLAAQNGPERLATALRRAGGHASGLASKGLDSVSSRTERAIEKAALALSERVVAGAGKLPGSPVAQAGAKLPARAARSRKLAKPQTTVEAVAVEVNQGVAPIKPRAARKPVAKPTAKATVKAATKPDKAAVKASTGRVRRAAKVKPVAAAVAAVQDAVAA